MFCFANKNSSAFIALKASGLFILALSLLVFAACSGSKETVQTPVEETTEPPPLEPTPPPANNPPEETKPVETAPAVPFVLLNVYFEFDRYDLTADALQKLADNATVLKAYPEVGIIIEGHCDERGTVEYNLALGDKRAKSAKDYLVSLGVNPSQVSTISYGKERPLDTRQTEEAWSKNRRAEFVKK